MSNFGKIKAQLDVSSKTAEFELYELEGDPRPVLILRPATIENAGYFNAALRRGSHLSKGRRKPAGLEEQIEEGLAEVRELWPAHVIAGWRHIRNDAGEEVAYTAALGCELLTALPFDVLNRLSIFAKEAANFRDGGSALDAPIDAVAVSGN